MKKFLYVFVLLATFAVAVPQGVVAQNDNARVISVDGRNYYIHTIVSGDTYYSLGRRYGVTEQDIRESNPRVDVLRVGETIKVPCGEVPQERISARKFARNFTEHVVAQGETTYSIARRYSMSVDALIADNPGLDPSHLSIGQVLRIRNAEKGGATFSEIDSQIADYAQTLNQHSDDYIYHNVVLGETIFSLSRRFGVEESAITDNNDLSDGLKVGMIIRIPADKSEIPATMEAATAVVVIDEDPEELPQPGEDGYGDPMWGVELPEPEGLDVEDLGGRLRVSMLLPLTNDNGAVRNIFAEFYQGALLALNELKGEGYSVILNLYDTRDNLMRVEEIVMDEEFRNSDLIIGPVYERNLVPVLEFAERRGIPVVSPLASIEETSSRVLFQLSPSATEKNVKLSELFTEDKNIVLIGSGTPDTEFAAEIEGLVADLPHRRVEYNKEAVAEIDSLFTSGVENMFVVLPRRELDVDMILAALSSIQNNRMARSISTGPVRVVGSSRWTSYNAMDRNLLFKLNATLESSYYVAPTAADVDAFDRRYIEAYHNLPSLYSYRGYDALLLFGRAMLAGEGDLLVSLNANTSQLAPYYFKRSDGRFVNCWWSLVEYHGNYTIETR